MRRRRSWLAECSSSRRSHTERAHESTCDRGADLGLSDEQGVGGSGVLGLPQQRDGHGGLAGPGDRAAAGPTSLRSEWPTMLCGFVRHRPGRLPAGMRTDPATARRRHQGNGRRPKAAEEFGRAGACWEEAATMIEACRGEPRNSRLSIEAFRALCHPSGRFGRTADDRACFGGERRATSAPSRRSTPKRFFATGPLLDCPRADRRQSKRQPWRGRAWRDRAWRDRASARGAMSGPLAPTVPSKPGPFGPLAQPFSDRAD